MIDFSLRCKPGGHRFDGWFRSGADFDRQAQAGLVTCPTCGSDAVEKALMAPAVALGERSPARPDTMTEQQPSEMAAGGVAQGGGAPATRSGDGEAVPAGTISPARQAEAYRKLQAIARTLRQHSENVGSRFAQEARRIHDGESDERSIYGQATREEVESLHEDGIAALPLPFLPEDGH